MRRLIMPDWFHFCRTNSWKPVFIKQKTVSHGKRVTWISAGVFTLMAEMVWIRKK